MPYFAAVKYHQISILSMKSHISDRYYTVTTSQNHWVILSLVTPNEITQTKENKASRGGKNKLPQCSLYDHREQTWPSTLRIHTHQRKKRFVISLQYEIGGNLKNTNRKRLLWNWNYKLGGNKLKKTNLQTGKYIAKWWAISPWRPPVCIYLQLNWRDV